MTRDLTSVVIVSLPMLCPQVILAVPCSRLMVSIPCISATILLISAMSALVCLILSWLPTTMCRSDSFVLFPSLVPS